MVIEAGNEQKTREIGEKIGRGLCGGEVIELVGDVGSGKTSLTKGIAVGLGVENTVSSPSFTISRQYECRNNLTLAHYDFYRLNDAGIMADEIGETIGRKDVITVIEWGSLVEGILPEDRISIRITTTSENSRLLEIFSNANLVLQ